jgi:hypothetical protein
MLVLDSQGWYPVSKAFYDFLKNLSDTLNKPTLPEEYLSYKKNDRVFFVKNCKTDRKIVDFTQFSDKALHRVIKVENATIIAIDKHFLSTFHFYISDENTGDRLLRQPRTNDNDKSLHQLYEIFIKNPNIQFVIDTELVKNLSTGDTLDESIVVSILDSLKDHDYKISHFDNVLQNNYSLILSKYDAFKSRDVIKGIEYLSTFYNNFSRSIFNHNQFTKFTQTFNNVFSVVSAKVSNYEYEPPIISNLPEWLNKLIISEIEECVKIQIGSSLGNFADFVNLQLVFNPHEIVDKKFDQNP